MLPRPIFRIWIERYTDIVLIYQMGKVASSTIYATLRQQPDILALHFHRMPGENMRALNARMGLKFRLRSIFHDMQGATGQRLLRRCPEKIRLVTLVRDPFSRNISGYFQNLWRHKSNAKSQEARIQEIVQSIATNYDHEVPLKWFDEEFYPATGIDVYDIAFDVEAKAGLSRDEKYPLLILRTDLADEGKLALLREFLDRPHLTLQRSNAGETKSYAYLYRAVKSDFIYPLTYIEQALSSKLMQHFFTEEERKSLKDAQFGARTQQGDAGSGTETKG